MKKALILCLGLLPALAFGQDENLRYEDHVYLDYVHSVKFHLDGLFLSMPILDLGGGSTPLALSFDALGEDNHSFVYSVEHCNANWTPSTLSEVEYIDGFNEEQIDFYEYSFKVKTAYTHYYFYLPNEDLRLTKSGNYLLKIYENDDEKRLAITRRFMVVETAVGIIPDVVRPSMVSKSNTHQEIDFRLTHKGFEIRNPRQELSVTVMQNGRWDNALTDLKPLFSRPDEQIYDYQDKIVFPSGKEFRYLDLRGIKYSAPGIQTIVLTDRGYEVTLEQEEKRAYQPYFEWNDINGNFIIENSDERGRIQAGRLSANESIARLNNDEEREYAQRESTATSQEERIRIRDERRRLLQQRRQDETQRLEDLYGDTENDFEEGIHNLQSEYASVLIQLYSPTEKSNKDLYIFGGLSDWQLKPEFKLIYNPLVSAYVGKVTLKQGYYDYMYAAVPKGSSKPDFEDTEGDWYETTNNYTILVYYRRFGGRYDALIGAFSFSSRF